MIDYQKIATESRKEALRLIFNAQTSHIGSCLSAADIVTVVFENADLEKDEFLLSKGWAAVLIYIHQARKGIIPTKDLERYCQEGEKKYIGLIEPIGGFGARFAGGSMQMGTAASVGFALAKKIKKEDGRIYVLESDGAIVGGLIWEACAIASHHKLSNLCVIFDINFWQATGKTSDVVDMEPLQKKFEAFGWEVTSINGHDYKEIEMALLKKTIKPHAVLAHTIKGKGVSFMEADGLAWHYRHIPADLYERANKELCQS